MEGKENKMSKAWLKVIFGAFCEVIWVIGMK
ncbi:MAG: QacE family quaternary ammonium compound efflux SMR transporter, partial [Enterococcus faecalis]